MSATAAMEAVPPSVASRCPSEAAASSAELPICASDGVELTAALRTLLEPQGFQCEPLLVGWYNSHVSAGFRLAQPADTLAVIVISTPAMFERCFLPHLRRRAHQHTDRPQPCRDPLDSCMRYVLAAAVRRVHPSARVLHDFEVGPTRRPRVLVQTAGHVSGAVTLYRRQDLGEDPWPASRRVYGVCLHPQFGGWFALRALVIMEGVTAPALPRPPPPRILTCDAQIRELLDLFNWSGADCRWRCVSGARLRYSTVQQRYFATPSGQRGPLVEQMARGEVTDEDDRPTAAGGREKGGIDECSLDDGVAVCRRDVIPS